jgi:hypothetical protein
MDPPRVAHFVQAVMDAADATEGRVPATAPPEAA